jgi:hypothetical protein
MAAAIPRLLETRNVAVDRPTVECGLDLMASGGDFADGRPQIDPNIVGPRSDPKPLLERTRCSRVRLAEGALGPPPSAVRAGVASRVSGLGHFPCHRKYRLVLSSVLTPSSSVSIGFLACFHTTSDANRRHSGQEGTGRLVGEASNMAGG